MQRLFTNTASKRDFFLNALAEYSAEACQVLIAVAFFTHAEPVLEMARRGCRVHMVVRLGYPTKPAALARLLGQEGIQVRFLTDSSFHPKLYLFAERGALVGSSNLTGSALTSNQEVNVELEADDPRYPDLITLFETYWSSARVLDRDALKLYEKAHAAHLKQLGVLDLLEREVLEKLGRVVANIERGQKAPKASELYLEEYRRTYQGFLDAYQTVERIYRRDGRRKVADPDFPIKLEVDVFFSFIREKKTRGDNYKEAPTDLAGPALEARIRGAIDEWHQTYWRHLHEVVLPRSFPTVRRVLSSREALEAASLDQIIEGLSCVNSFYDRLRFFPGGHETHVQTFKQENDPAHIKKVLTYLLFGRDDYLVRMGRCIFHPEWRLNHFGRSAVQELLGWVSQENIPICNNRTLRALRWLGFNIRLVGD